MWDFGSLTYGRLGRAMYLDTNVWSELAKRRLPPESIKYAIEGRANYLILGPYQLIELSRRPDLIGGLDALFDVLPVCLAGWSDQSELSGRNSWQVEHDFFVTLHTATPEGRQVWREQMASGIAHQGWDAEKGPIIAARLTDIELFRARWPKKNRGRWQDHFWSCLDSYLNGMCMTGGHEYRSDKLRDRDYYRGRKLHFALWYRRHYLNPKAWEDSDWLDLLHGMQMAYSAVAVVERSLAADLLKIREELPELAAPQSYSISDIRRMSSKADGES
ncbi:hypothetical protein [Paractinoplanes hotanensis]|uniref:Uncharacterized protein n=1 Tax=Paractinoplanes hotanensis TaxID=2906497 RepID=A0ABT0YGD6_9ACTN|nr:hypothetical protein [Actinoplanes hotanensis]MCM4085147.1 hypothetical protein [Actinoplanes hotanensis]